MVEGDGTVQVFMEVLAGNLMAEVDVTVTPSSVTAIANSGIFSLSNYIQCLC